MAALTGISAGRIRHYEARGLVTPAHLDSGYRSFSAADVLRLLHIDLLRSLGVGLSGIRASLDRDPGGVRSTLERHRAALADERARLEALLSAVDVALADPDATAESMVGALAAAHRRSLGRFGRLAQPLTPAAAGLYDRVLAEGWDLPVPPLFAQLLLPDPVTDLLEALAAAPGCAELFDRLRELARRVVALAGEGASLEDAERLGRDWVLAQVASPPSPAVVEVLRRHGPRVAALPVIEQGLPMWAASISPQAGAALRAMAGEARRQGVRILGAVVIPAAPARRPGRSGR